METVKNRPNGAIGVLPFHYKIYQSTVKIVKRWLLLVGFVLNIGDLKLKHSILLNLLHSKKASFKKFSLFSAGYIVCCYFLLLAFL